MASPDNERRRVERGYLRFAEVGVQYGLTIVLLTVLGIWLDGRFGTRPLCTLVLLAVGFIGATYSLVHTVLGPPKGTTQGPDKGSDKPNDKA